MQWEKQHIKHVTKFRNFDEISKFCNRQKYLRTNCHREKRPDIWVFLQYYKVQRKAFDNLSAVTNQTNDKQQQTQTKTNNDKYRQIMTNTNKYWIGLADAGRRPGGQQTRPAWGQKPVLVVAQPGPVHPPQWTVQHHQQIPRNTD